MPKKPEEETKKDELSKELQDSLRDIIKSCRKEDDDIHRSMVRQWKKNEEFWHGVQYLFWSENDESWRSPLDVGWEGDDDEEIQEQLGSFSDKVVDIFRAHGEAIIAALSAQIPSLRFLPDDADNPDDLATARTNSKIAELVQRHNKAKLVFLRALFFLAIHGVVASYRYKDADLKYGSYKVPQYDSVEQDVPTYTCESCGYSASEDWSPEPCPQCQNPEPPEVSSEKQQVPQKIGEEELPKSRARIDIFGPLHFKVPYYARNQEECTYFLLRGDLGKDSVKEAYPDFADEIEQESLQNTDLFSRSAYSLGSDPEVDKKHLITVTKNWLRPAALYRENDESKRKKLLEKYPKGVKVTLFGRKDTFVDAKEDELDKRWVIGQAGLSTYIYSDPILRPLVQIQEMRNQLVNLIIETISHGIPSEFADPEVVNFDTYGRFEAVPGYIYQAKARKPGEALGNSFYTSNRATLSREVSMFLKQLDQDAQFCVGAFPSIYGGPSEGKSRTFSEYAASRQMALQRLQIVWTFVVEWWTKTIEGCVELYKECVVEDERFTKFDNGNYINVWIKRADLSGKVGGVESEASETFPTSLTQKKDLILKLMELNNEYINSVLYLPDNARIIQDCFALTDLKIPGEAQRVKQIGEIYILLQQAPVDPVQSSVPINQDVDDHKVHIETITTWAVSDIGLDMERTNPEGFANCIAHLHEHQQAMILQTIQVGGGGTPAGAPPETTQGQVEE